MASIRRPYRTIQAPSQSDNSAGIPLLTATWFVRPHEVNRRESRRCESQGGEQSLQPQDKTTCDGWELAKRRSPALMPVAARKGTMLAGKRGQHCGYAMVSGWRSCSWGGRSEFQADWLSSAFAFSGPNAWIM